MMTLLSAKCLPIFLILFFMDVPVHSGPTEAIPKIPEDLLPDAEQIYRDHIISNAELMKNNLPYFSEMDDLNNFKLDNPIPHYKLYTEIIYSMEDTVGIHEAMELLTWRILIYIKRGDGLKPRTYLNVKRDNEDSWRYSGAGGYPEPVLRAMKKWPPEDGYRYATLIFSDPHISLIMFKRNKDLKFWFYNDEDEGGNRIFGLTRKEDGSWPAISTKELIRIIQSDKKYSKRNKSESPNNLFYGYRPSVIAIENEYTTYKAFDGGNLDILPEITHFEKPEYPMLSRQAGIEGKAVLEVAIGADGRVESAKIIESKVTPGMEYSLLEAAKKFVYQPGIIGSKPIKCKATHLINFTLNDDVIRIDIK